MFYTDMKTKHPSEIQPLFEEYLRGLSYSHSPENLYAPIRYVLSLGRKRIRPTLLIMSYNIYADDIETTFDVAAAMEIFHNFTLLHDDVMDKADMRRGYPTVHKKWNENTAILSGDGMLVLAYRYLSMTKPEYLKKVLDLANDTFLGITDGQQYDMDFESRTDVSISDYLEMIRLKTSVLLAACSKMGGLLGGACEEDTNHLYRFGEKIGLAFQLQDDLLDVYGDSKIFGKKIGGDIVCNKKTYLYIIARQLADMDGQKELDKWAEYKGEDEELKISGVRSVFDSVNVKGLTENRIELLFEDAINEFNMVSVNPERKQELMVFAHGLMNRVI
jgi:geranylgeranyl diphosphate synthase, type II